MKTPLSVSQIASNINNDISILHIESDGVGELYLTRLAEGIYVSAEVVALILVQVDLEHYSQCFGICHLF